MELPDFIDMGQREPALRFLIIGGYAVAAHGHTRATFDVDFLVRRSEQSMWMSRAVEVGLKLESVTNNFAQFSQTTPADALDLMFVEDPTFDQMWQASEERTFGRGRARIPRLDHLIALKLHALKQSLPHRTAKDAEDVETLVRRHALKLSDPQYKQLFLKYGTQELYETFLRILRTP